MNGYAVSALAVMDWAKRNNFEIVSALANSLTSSDVMYFCWSFTLLQVFADNTAQPGYSGKVEFFRFIFCSAHAVPPARTKTPFVKKRRDWGNSFLCAIVISRLAQCYSAGCSDPFSL
ncbi:MAG: hypothetical protein RSE38_02225 [Acinetobacter sp.]